MRRWLLGRIGGRAGGGPHAARARQRHRRLDPEPVAPVRDARPQAQLRDRARPGAHPRPAGLTWAVPTSTSAAPWPDPSTDLELGLDVLAGPDEPESAGVAPRPAAGARPSSGHRGLAGGPGPAGRPGGRRRPGCRRDVVERRPAVDAAGPSVDTGERPAFERWSDRDVQAVDGLAGQLIAAALSALGERDDGGHRACATGTGWTRTSSATTTVRRGPSCSTRSTCCSARCSRWRPSRTRSTTTRSASPPARSRSATTRVTHVELIALVRA